MSLFLKYKIFPYKIFLYKYESQIQTIIYPKHCKYKNKINLNRYFGNIPNCKNSNDTASEDHCQISGSSFDRHLMLDLIKKRFIYDSSFDIYGGISGQYDYGPIGCSLLDNILIEWNKWFVNSERMLKLNCPVLTPEIVFKASGHVEKFTDTVVKDLVSGDLYRLDHLIKDHLQSLMSSDSTSSETCQKVEKLLNRIDGMTKAEMKSVVQEYNIRSPLTGGELSEPTDLNLMFPMSFGSTGSVRGYLRPEIAQGIFTNFKRLLNYNNGKLPFACAQVGNVYRNEISTKYGLLRMREFTTAEIEYFYSPLDRNHPKFDQISNVKVPLYSIAAQTNQEETLYTTISDAIKLGHIQNEHLAYFLARIYLFLRRVGIDRKSLRFRQHLQEELAHYAHDCWDLEILTSYGWVECVGCANRRAFDLNAHSKVSGVELCAEIPLKEPVQEERSVLHLNKGEIKRVFSDKAVTVIQFLTKMSSDECKQFERQLQDNGEVVLQGDFLITSKMVKGIKTKVTQVSSQKVIPHVIEPSFGINRIFYSLLEHSFRRRDNDEKRKYFAFPAHLAPIKLGVLPVVNRPQFSHLANQLADQCSRMDLSSKVEDSRGSIGRRYVRMDEMGVPFCATIDDVTLKSPSLVTLRDRDSTRQVRIPIEEVADCVKSICDGRLTWEIVLSRWPSVT